MKRLLYFLILLMVATGVAKAGVWYYGDDEATLIASKIGHDTSGSEIDMSSDQLSLTASNGFLNLQTTSTNLIFASGTVLLGNQSQMRFEEQEGSGGFNYVSFQAATSLAANVHYVLPDADGSNGEVLQTDGAGTLSWAPAPAGGSATGAGREGCNPTRLSLTELRIGPCSLSINGVTIATATGTDITLEPALQVATAPFYIYAEDGSSGTTLNATTVAVAPDANGLRPGTNDKIIGRGFNRGEAAYGIDDMSLDAHDGADFRCQESSWRVGANVLTAETTDPTLGTTERNTYYYRRVNCDEIHIKAALKSPASASPSAGSGNYFNQLPPGTLFATGVGASPWINSPSLGGGNDDFSAGIPGFNCIDDTDATGGPGVVYIYDGSKWRSMYWSTSNGIEYALGTASGPCTLNANGMAWGWDFKTKIENWSY